MLVFRMLCRITQSSDAHRTESVSVMDHEQTMRVSSRVLDHPWPYLVVLERRTARSPRVAERSWPRLVDSDTGEHSSARYFSAAWCRHLYTRTYTLYSILCWTRSQCSQSWTSVVMWSNFHFFNPVFSRHSVGYTVTFENQNWRVVRTDILTNWFNKALSVTTRRLRIEFLGPNNCLRWFQGPQSNWFLPECCSGVSDDEEIKASWVFSL